MPSSLMRTIKGGEVFQTIHSLAVVGGLEYVVMYTDSDGVYRYCRYELDVAIAHD